MIFNSSGFYNFGDATQVCLEVQFLSKLSSFVNFCCVVLQRYEMLWCMDAKPALISDFPLSSGAQLCQAAVRHQGPVGASGHLL